MHCSSHGPQRGQIFELKMVYPNSVVSLSGPGVSTHIDRRGPIPGIEHSGGQALGRLPDTVKDSGIRDIEGGMRST